MAGNIAPKIINDSSLVLYLDAANTKSYVSGSTTWNDISRGVNPGTLTNGPIFSTSSNGNIIFDGIDDYLPISTLSVNMSSFTFSFFIKSTDQSYDGSYARAFINQIVDANNGYVFTQFPDVLRFFVKYNGIAYQIGTVVPTPLNTICNIVATHNLGVLKLYINGIDSSWATTDYRDGGDSIPTIARRGINIGKYSGNIYNVQIYNRALSQLEITQNYNAMKGRFGL